jgi:hypothetical protein
MRSLRIVFALACAPLGLVSTACSTGAVRELSWPHPIHGRPVTLHVDPDDGIDEAEAQILVGLYWGLNFSGCGAPGPVQLEGDRWTSTPRFGYAGSPGKNSIVVDARTGAISYEDWPPFENSSDLLGDPRVAELVRRKPSWAEDP